jgi:hypothetical protein
MRCSLMFFWAAVLAAAAEYDPTEVLKRATQRVLDSARRIPNYTCVETVTRDYREPIAALLPRSCPVLLEQRLHPTPDLLLLPYSKDRLRLDVAMSRKGEIFSWSGANRFEDREIDQVVRYGPMATGSFAGFLITVFETDVRKFNFERTIQSARGPLLEYSFQVALPDSHYKMKFGTTWGYIAYSGSFQLAPETADLVQMAVVTSDLPLAAEACLTTTNLDFHRVEIGSGQFLLPKQVTQRFVYPNAAEAENTTYLANCREFRGESTITFSPGEPAAAAGGAARVSSDSSSLPGGVRFTMALTSAISSDAAAAGDAFTGKLAEAARDNVGKVVAPKGTLVEGRLLRVQSYAKPPEVVVVLKPEVMWVRGVRVAIHAVRDWTYVIAQRWRQGKGAEILIPLRGEENSGAFRFSGEHVVIPAGYHTDWKTIV